MAKAKKPETSIPKFIEEQSKPKKPPKEDIAQNVLEYCVSRATLDLSLLTSAERKRLLDLIRKSIPKEGTKREALPVDPS
jgi:hypothetical protein